MKDSESSNEKKPSKKKKKSLRYRLHIFSMQYLAHHPMCMKFNNHFFKLGPLVFCVGCTSVFLAFIAYTILFFTIPWIFQTYPLVDAVVAAFGVGLALLQLLIKPENKWLKATFRFYLGLALGAYTGLIILVENWGLKFGLFLFLIPGVFLYNILRGPSPYLECKECNVKFTEPTCDYNTVSEIDR